GKLSVFRGTFDLEAANAVAGAPLPLLASLADISLLQANGKGRYALHDLLRHYAVEKLATQVDAASHQERAINYLNRAAERANNVDDQRQAADYLGQAIAIAEDASKSALLIELHHKRGDLVIAAMVKLGGVLTNDGNLEEAVGLYERAVTHGGNAQGDTYNGLGRTLYWLGRYNDAVPHLRRAVELQQGDPVNQIFPLQDLGLALAATGAYTEAVSVFGQAQRLSREYEEWPLLARSVANSAGFHLDVFDYTGNQTLAEEARALARVADFVLAEVSAGLDLLVNFARRQEVGRAAKLIDEVAEAVENAQGTHGWLWRLRFMQACAELALARGSFDESQRLASTALQEGREIGRVKYQVLALKTRAQALVAQGDTAAALVDLRNALDITRPTADPALFFQVASVLLPVEGNDALAQEAYTTAQRIRAALPSDEMRQIFAAAEPVRQVARLVG
ncbi:MAG TPA: tetratricopeptide repeat protein, partial [Ktedonobacterales bacterium]|nr:tetratricopeptide repeat protein [Ktedonobacterales bacterium]